jgi:predicted 3-demethylubiquinone-9 3-methyltransferase (glyoxalase superfamily)
MKNEMVKDEEKLQRAYWARISNLGKVLEREGLKVVDTSVFVPFKKLIPVVNSGLAVEFDNGFWEWCRDNFDEKVYFTDEVCEEYLGHTDYLIKLAQKYENMYHARGWPKDREKALGFNTGAKERLEFYTDCMDDSKVESIMEFPFGNDLEKPSTSFLYDVVKNIGKYDGVFVNTNVRNKGQVSKKNDSRIFTKAWATSYDDPVTLVTRDGDFKRLYVRLVKGKERFEKALGFPIHLDRFNVAYQRESGVHVYDDKRGECLARKKECDFEDRSEVWK